MVLLAVTIVLVGILVFRLHAFLVLLLASLSIATLTSPAAIGRFAAAAVAADRMTQGEADALRARSAPQRVVAAFGDMAGQIGIVIALASVIGSCLAASGAAMVIVRRLLRLTGPRRAPEALAASSFVLGIPVFFDTVFLLMIPLARSLRHQRGADYALLICAIIAGGSIAHSLIPPTPGPLLVAGVFGIEIGTMLLAGAAVGSLTSLLSLLVARLINRWADVPLRVVGGGSGELPPTTEPAGDLPSLPQSLLPIVTPLLLIAGGSLTASLVQAGWLAAGPLPTAMQFLADKNVALAIGAALALRLTRYCPADQRAPLVSQALSSGGAIILITAAGGAFGAMLRQAGIGEAVASLVVTVPATLLLPAAFLITAAIRTLQGSATVAMITSAGVLQGIAESQGLPFHPVYLAMAIGVGSKPISWMNDSGFWVITKMSGMTEAEGLRVVTPMLTAMGICGLGVTMVLALLFPAAS